MMPDRRLEATAQPLPLVATYDHQTHCDHDVHPTRWGMYGAGAPADPLSPDSTRNCYATRAKSSEVTAAASFAFTRGCFWSTTAYALMCLNI